MVRRSRKQSTCTSNNNNGKKKSNKNKRQEDGKRASGWWCSQGKNPTPTLTLNLGGGDKDTMVTSLLMLAENKNCTKGVSVNIEGDSKESTSQVRTIDQPCMHCHGK